MENIPLTPKRREIETADMKIKRREQERAKIKAAFLNYYGQMVESGKPEHIITSNEAKQIWDVIPPYTLAALLKKTYGTGSLNEVLEGMNFPFKKRGGGNDY